MKPRTPKGFTLTEMLVAMTIIIALAALVFSLSSRMISNAQKAVCVSNFRGIGNALQMYVSEANGRLPGPLNTGQSALYNKDPRSLVTYIGPYLEDPRDGGTEPYLINNYGCPSIMKLVKENTTAKPPVVYRLEDRQNKLLDTSVPANDISYPWGYNAGTIPKRLDEINPRSAGMVRMITEQNTTLGYGGWSNVGPAKPAHGKQSMALYWDFSVRPVVLSQL
jgi:prepilin-type N-terminal cleavage/methylation domain-containing protein